MLRKVSCLLALAATALAASGTQEFDVLLEDMVEKVNYHWFDGSLLGLANGVIDCTTSDTLPGSTLCR